MIWILFSSLLVLGSSWASSSTTLAPTPSPGPKVWVLLIAGSNGWNNYRHQADICHAYQIFTGGIPEKNIILMMYDDIAYNPKNPFPGVITEATSGSNLYDGVVKDYTGKDVTPENFLNVLRGEKKAMNGIGSGKVIESGPEDYIFVNFVGHGSDGILLFPNNQILSSNDLLNALKEKSNNKGFDKMFIYVDAEESGSLFEDVLKDDTNVFVMTSSDTLESSSASSFNDTLGVYLTDVFSWNWMLTVETETLSDFSFHHIFQTTRTYTSTSHVQEFGNLNIGNTKASKVFPESKQVSKKSGTYTGQNRENTVLQSETKLEGLQILLQKATEQKNDTKIRILKSQITTEIHRRLTHMGKMDKILWNITNDDSDKIHSLKSTLRRSSNNVRMNCYRDVLKDYFALCLNFSESEFMYATLKYLRVACDAKWTNARLINRAIYSVCQGSN